MSRRNRFLIALLSAGFTFASLTVAVGTDHWKYRGHYWGHHGHHHGCYDHHHHDGDSEKPEDPGTPES